MVELERNKNLTISAYYLLSMFLFVCAMAFGIAKLIVISIVFCLVAGVIAVFGIIKQHGQLFSLTMVFWIFHLIYGLSVPLTIVFGSYYSETFGTDNVKSNIYAFLIVFSIASIGFLLGCGINKKRSLKDVSHVDIDGFKNKKNFKRIDIGTLITGAYISAFVASVCEIINIMRVGGFGMLFIGKGAFQSAVGDLTLTLPSSNFYSICGMFIGLMIGVMKNQEIYKRLKIHFIMPIVLLIPFLISKIILGQRGILISAILWGIACYSTLYPIKKVTFKLCAIAFVCYIFMVFLYTNRGVVSLLLTNPDEFISIAFDPERFMSNFNPGSSEFGAAVGNFCVFYDKYGYDFPLKLGFTYLQGLVVPIPSFLYFGTKPQQITYAFRDEFFYSWTDRSRVASTGFSSILEAYMNWSFIGVLLVYFVIGIIIFKLDKARCKCNSTITIMLCSSLAGICLSFSRNAFGTIFDDMVYNFIYIYIIYYISKALHVRVKQDL